MKEDARTFIISRLTNLVEDISELKILYKFDAYSREHLVKVLPLIEAKKNSSYHRFEEEFLFEFIEKFPADNLVFLTEGDWIDIKKPDQEFVGLLYLTQSITCQLKKGYAPTFNDNILFSINSISEDFVNIAEILESFSKIKIEKLEPIQQNNFNKDGFFGHTSINNLCFFSKSDSLSDVEYPCDTNCDCDNYALAA